MSANNKEVIKIICYACNHHKGIKDKKTGSIKCTRCKSFQKANFKGVNK